MKSFFVVVWFNGEKNELVEDTRWDFCLERDEDSFEVAAFIKIFLFRG
jgi:hypothetical protein